jgi:molybdate-binding protein/DNA-binding XRE family transcriptional regulator
MSTSHSRHNRVKQHRDALGWSQAELAQRTGISRTGVSAIEGERLVPSVEAALALARVFQCSVEDLFRGYVEDEAAPQWAWPPLTHPCRYWSAEVAGKHWLYPVESCSPGIQRHDGLLPRGDNLKQSPEVSRRTLVVACCDPAAGILAHEYQQQTGLRMIVLTRSSRESLELLQRGLVHAAGIHWADASELSGNALALREHRIQSNVQLLHIADWQEGLALGRGTELRTVRQAVSSHLRWVGRLTGAGARRCQDEVLGDRRAPTRTARDHRGVVEAIRNGWADVGVCVRLASEEGQLDFLPVSEERYELCIPVHLMTDPRLVGLIKVVRSPSYRTVLAELPGYRATRCGELQLVKSSTKEPRGK